MRARCVLVAGLVGAFLTVALAPCPERPSRGAHAASEATSVAQQATGGGLSRGDGLSLVPACPCGCEKAPAAGSSARLGVALPSATVAWVATRPVPPAVDLHARRIEPFAARIDHVPLAGPRIPA